MIVLEIGLEIRHGGMIRVCAIVDKTAVVVVASYPSNPVRFKAMAFDFKVAAAMRCGHSNVAFCLFLVTNSKRYRLSI